MNSDSFTEFLRQNPQGHVWERNTAGEVEYEETVSPHGGPRCTRCLRVFCVHCPDEITACEGSEERPQPRVRLTLGDWPAQPIPFHYYDPATGLELVAEIDGEEVRGKARMRQEPHEGGEDDGNLPG